MAGVQLGQAVIDEIGVVGQVTRVFPYMSEVTLVTDKDHAVPVKVERSGLRSVMYGAGTAELPELRFLSPNAEIQAGRQARHVRHRRHLSRRARRGAGRVGRARDRAGVRPRHLQAAGRRRARRSGIDSEPRRGIVAASRRAGRSRCAAQESRQATKLISIHAATVSLCRRATRRDPPPAKPWFVLLTLLVALVANAVPASGVALAAQAGFPGAGTALLVHPGAAADRRRHRVVRGTADGCRRRDGVRPACVGVRAARLRRGVFPPPRSALSAVAAGGAGRGSARCAAPRWCCSFAWSAARRRRAGPTPSAHWSERSSGRSSR